MKVDERKEQKERAKEKSNERMRERKRPRQKENHEREHCSGSQGAQNQHLPSSSTFFQLLGRVYDVVCSIVLPAEGLQITFERFPGCSTGKLQESTSRIVKVQISSMDMLLQKLNMLNRT